MGNIVAEHQMQEILQVVKQAEGGILFSDIYDAFKKDVSKRTLQRRLNHLVEKGLLIHRGSGRSSMYQVADVFEKGEKTGETTIAQRNLKLSLAAMRVKEKVNRPIEERVRVQYRHEFLAAYIPNETFYLSRTNRDYLKAIGMQPNGDLPAGTFAKKILNHLMVDLSWNSSRLEGNTYSLLETEKLLLQNIQGEEKSLTETQMILNHKAAIEFLIDSVEEINFDRFAIFNLHALLSKNLLGNPASCGRIRNIPVGIGKTRYEPLNIPQLLEERFNDILSKATQISDPYEQAFFILVHIPYLQAFEDINKRVSRVSANIPFIKNNLSPLSFVDVPEKEYIDAILGVYELNETILLEEVFVWAYERSAMRYSAIRKVVGEPDEFRMQYRVQIREAIQYVVRSKINKKEVTKVINDWVEKNEIPENNCMRFVAVVEEELLGLHSGNIAPYKLTLDEFDQWHKIWG